MAKNIVKVLNAKGNVAQVMVKGTSPAMMNAIRRTILNEVPILAIEEISMYENNGVLFDEFLAHRIGMVPIKTDSKTYKLGDKVKVSLDVSGPATVYSKEIKVADPALSVLDKNIPLAKLKANQRIRLEGEAIAGTGKQHVKYQPAIIGYRMLPQFKIAESVSVEEGKKVVDSCPVNIIEMKGKKLNITEPADCTLCGKCEETGGSSVIQVDPDDSGFVFNIETSGSLSPEEVVHGAFAILEEKTKDFLKEIKDAL
mgnify:CR=1 FL=1